MEWFSFSLNTSPSKSVLLWWLIYLRCLTNPTWSGVLHPLFLGAKTFKSKFLKFPDQFYSLILNMLLASNPRIPWGLFYLIQGLYILPIPWGLRLVDFMVCARGWFILGPGVREEVGSGYYCWREIADLANL